MKRKRVHSINRATAYLLSVILTMSCFVLPVSVSSPLMAYADEITEDFTATGLDADSTSVIKEYPEAVSGSEAAGVILSSYNAEMNRGYSVQLGATVLPADAEDKSVTWSSSNNSVAVVDSTGLVTGLSAGKAEIRAQAANGVYAACAVSVYVPATKIWFEESNITINKGETRALTPKFSPADASPKLVWTLEESNSGVQLDKESGNVTGLFGGGTARILVETVQPGKDPADQNYYFDSTRARCNITVESHATDMVLSNDKLNVTIGEDFSVTAQALPEGATDRITWSYTDNLFLDYGSRQNRDTSAIRLAAQQVGRSVLTAKTEGGIERSCEIIVDRADISEASFTLYGEKYWYDGQEKQPLVGVYYNGHPLVTDTDYSLSYSNNREVGVGSVIVTGKNNYQGQKTLKFLICDTSSLVMTLEENFFIYDGSPKRPAVKVYDGSTLLTEGTDYVTTYSNNVQPGTATATITGIGKLSGSKSMNFTISREERIDLSKCSASLDTATFIYDGGEKRPAVTVYDGKNKLAKDTDYLVTYNNNIKVGTATAVLEGIGKYSGSRTLEYTIVAPEKRDITEFTVTLSQLSYTYDGSAKTPEVTVKNQALTLTKNTDYTVEYTNNIEPGNAIVTVTGAGEYKGTRTLTFTITKPAEPDNPDKPDDSKNAFIWGVDNWNFINASYTGHYKDDTYKSMINQVYLDTLKENLTPTEYEYVFKGTDKQPAWLDEQFGGCCYGMTTTTLLAKLGYLPFSDYQPGISKLNDLDYPAKNPLDYPTDKTNVSSLIVYYQMVQIKPCMQKYRMYAKRSHKDNITDMIDLLDKNPTVSVGFRKEGWGGHSILAYDYEYGSFNKNGTDYQGRIKICDPNSANQDNDDYYIYFNTTDYSWEIPAYSSKNVKSKSGAYFNFVNADIDVVNEGGYLSGSSKTNNTLDYVARMDVYSGSNDRSVTKVQKSGESYSMMNNAPGDIEECYSYVAIGESEGVIGYNLYDANASYKVVQPNAEPLELSINYDNSLMTGSSKSGNSVIFDKNGCIEIHGEKSDYSMSMTSNDSHPTDWFTVSVDGEQASFASLEKKSEGWVVTADELKNVKVNANNKYSEVSTTFSTQYESALIYEIDQDTIGIAVDADNNGTYETTLRADGQEPEPTPEPIPDKPVPNGIYGDLDGDKQITSNDALTMLRSSVGITVLTSEQFVLADVDGDKNITANDALAVLRFSVGMGGDNKIGRSIAA